MERDDRARRWWSIVVASVGFVVATPTLAQTSVGSPLGSLFVEDSTGAVVGPLVGTSVVAIELVEGGGAAGVYFLPLTSSLDNFVRSNRYFYGFNCAGPNYFSKSDLDPIFDVDSRGLILSHESDQAYVTNTLGYGSFQYSSVRTSGGCLNSLGSINGVQLTPIVDLTGQFVAPFTIKSEAVPPLVTTMGNLAIGLLIAGFVVAHLGSARRKGRDRNMRAHRAS